MNRRAFLKLCGLTAVAPALPVAAAKTSPIGVSACRLFFRGQEIKPLVMTITGPPVPQLLKDKGVEGVTLGPGCMDFKFTMANGRTLTTDDVDESFLAGVDDLFAQGQ